jgi:hypothetical protein
VALPPILEQVSLEKDALRHGAIAGILAAFGSRQGYTARIAFPGGFGQTPV